MLYLSREIIAVGSLNFAYLIESSPFNTHTSLSTGCLNLPSVLLASYCSTFSMFLKYWSGSKCSCDKTRRIWMNIEIYRIPMVY